MNARRLRGTPFAGGQRRMIVPVIWAALVMAGTLATAGSELSPSAPGPDASGTAVALESAAPTGEATSAGPSAVPAASGSEAPEEAEAVTLNENAGGAGGNNIVLVSNRNDESFRMRGRIQVNRINAPNVAPQNLAVAHGINCTGCETYAVAMQINLIGPDTRRAVPANAAVAVNSACSSCVTAAEAFQYTLTVDDPMDMPAEARQLIRVMEAELREISHESETVVEALVRVDAVEVRFKALAHSLDQELEVAATDPSGSDQPTPTAMPSATATPAPTVAPETPAATPSLTSSPSATPEPTPIPQPSP
jgi:hypothetical protein